MSEAQCEPQPEGANEEPRDGANRDTAGRTEESQKPGASDATAAINALHGVNEAVGVNLGAVETSGTPIATATSTARIKDSTQDIWALAQFVLLVMTIALFINTFLVQAFRIPSGSMEDTLLVGDYLLVDKARWAPAGSWNLLLPYQPVRRGEIVVFHYPVEPDEFFVKRVVGLPGDRIHLQQGRVWCNGRTLDEPYAVFKDRMPDEYRDNFPRGVRYNENLRPAWASELRKQVQHGELVVPEGQYFVLGDNRDRSLDGRYWGFVPRAYVVGRPVLVYFSVTQTDDDEDRESRNAHARGVASGAADDKLSLLRARFSHLFGELRWRRILRVAP